jgi:hypothetical protein
MDVVLQVQFQHVEAALTTLIDSITSYNPSPQAAIDLVEADDELSKGLEQLSIHQANHARILSLRDTASKLENQVKANLETLASLRHELLKTPATTLPVDARPVPFDELLRFAKNISRFTVPPTYREPLPTDDQPSPQAIEAPPAPSPNGVTPASAAPDTADEKKDEGKDYDHDLTPQQSEWLKKLQESGSQWVPWPSTDKIRAGNLMQIQNMIERGEDPSKVLSPEEQEAEKKRAEEREAQERRDREEEEEREKQRRAAYAHRPSAAQPAVFGGLDMYDPDEME